MGDEVLIQVENVSKKFCLSLKSSLWYGIQDIASELVGRKYEHCLRPKEFWALKDVSFELKRGESLGLIGSNGAGKSTLLKLLNSLIKPDEGRIIVRGKIGALIELGTGFNPILTGRENIYANAAILGMSKQEVDRVFDDIVDFSGVIDFIDTPVQNYSSGMQVRLGFGVAAYLNPDILVVDEVLAVGDIAFQRKCLKRMMQYLKSGGILILVSHNMHLVQSICNRTLVLERGKTYFQGSVEQGIGAYFDLQNSNFKTQDQNRDSLESNTSTSITKIELLPTKDTTVRTGSSVSLHLHYKSLQSFEKVSWTFSIWTADLWTRITTGRARFSGLVHQVKKGEGKLCCTIPHLPLIAGTYAIRAQIIDLQTTWPIAEVGQENSAFYFTVESSAMEIENRGATDGDLIILDIEWE